MRILYSAYRHDPRDPDAASGADFNFYRSLAERGHDMSLVGPFRHPPSAWERVLKRLYQRGIKKRYAKFPHSLTRRASAGLNRAEEAAKADVVFTLFQPSLVFYRGSTPCVFRLDTSFRGYQSGYEEFGDLAMKLNIWQEHRAFARCSHLITHSGWSAEGLARDYGFDARRIHTFPNPSALPQDKVPDGAPPPRSLAEPLELLTVGRNFHRKGIDIAMETTRQLNRSGNPTRLTICGLSGSDEEHIRFVGPFRKSRSQELETYLELYRRSHLLLHPARFDPSPIVTAEAAAFGLPVVTRDVGGIATSVKNGTSGVVLPAGAMAEAFSEAIARLMAQPQRYHRLCIDSRRRYESDLNWQVAGGRVEKVLRLAAEEGKCRGGVTQ
ncbi:MAG: glycosyltransferase family 4 protein [Deltaproteobacteria bacterium]|nr:glycosyltransferase family 4 protein [Deltaproteobacteria bacterium]